MDERKGNRRGRKPMPEGRKRVHLHVVVAPETARIIKGKPSPGHFVDELVRLFIRSTARS